LRPSAIGLLAECEWLRTFLIRENLAPDVYVIMPNHIHGIVRIEDGSRRGTARRAPTFEQFGRPLRGSLPTLVRAFKAAATKRLGEIRGSARASLWQRGYYEHVIRDDESLERVREYIVNNPLRWDLDRENPGRAGEDAFDRWLATFRTRPG